MLFGKLQQFCNTESYCHHHLQPVLSHPGDTGFSPSHTFLFFFFKDLWHIQKAFSPFCITELFQDHSLTTGPGCTHIQKITVWSVVALRAPCTAGKGATWRLCCKLWEGVAMQVHNGSNTTAVFLFVQTALQRSNLNMHTAAREQCGIFIFIIICCGNG